MHRVVEPCAYVERASKQAGASANPRACMPPPLQAQVMARVGVSPGDMSETKTVLNAVMARLSPLQVMRHGCCVCGVCWLCCKSGQWCHTGPPGFLDRGVPLLLAPCCECGALKQALSARASRMMRHTVLPCSEPRPRRLPCCECSLRCRQLLMTLCSTQ